MPQLNAPQYDRPSAPAHPLADLAAGAALGALVGYALHKYPAVRLVFAGLFAVVAVALFAAGGGAIFGGLISLAIAGLFIWWARQPNRDRATAADTAAARATAVSTPEGVSELLTGTTVTVSGDPSLVGWKIERADVVDNTFRTADGQVWADVDLILANSHAVAATFYAYPAEPTVAWWAWKTRPTQQLGVLT